MSMLKNALPGQSLAGFQLIKKQYVASKTATLYTLCHQKTKAELLYLDRPDENKTFAIAFKTLPSDSTGVFHILEHSVLNGSDRYPVKEPFVSMLQGSMQTFLNAFTFSDKTVYPVASRNEQDFYNLMGVYLDAVFHPAIYHKKEIFMQEGWHYEWEEGSDVPYYNGVVFNEMKGVYSEVDQFMEEHLSQLLFPDTCYGYSSGGDPAHIPDLSYEQFIATHKRFYHPSNARIFLDGSMDIDKVLHTIDEQCLSHYNYRAPDFDFVMQKPKKDSRKVFYQAQQDEKDLSHMIFAKIFADYTEPEKIYAAHILSDYLTGTNESPLKRAFLEQGLGQDVIVSVNDGVLQPVVELTLRNMSESDFARAEEFLPKAIERLLQEGLNKEALRASLEQFAFSSLEIREPYGIELALKALDSWLYGSDPLTYLNNGVLFDSLRQKLDTDYFEKLLQELFCRNDLSTLWVCPSLTKADEEGAAEEEKVTSLYEAWDDKTKESHKAAFLTMQQWQKTPDSPEALATLPHLDPADVEREAPALPTQLTDIAQIPTLQVSGQTNGIIYLNLYFDLSDLSVEQLRQTAVLAGCMGELSTVHYSALALQTKIKTLFGKFLPSLEITAPNGELETCKPYLQVAVSMLEKNAEEGLALIGELLCFGQYTETDRISEILKQGDYYFKQNLINNGHTFAMTKALSAFSAQGALNELLSGEEFLNWYSTFTASFDENATAFSRELTALAHKVIGKKRLFVGYSGSLPTAPLQALIDALPDAPLGDRAAYPHFSDKASVITIPASVSFSALGHNLYRLGGHYCGSLAVLSALMTYGYLWNAVRVQGGAYGTGMRIRPSGDMFCYSYRDPDPENSRQAFLEVADALEEMLEEMPLNDYIIGAVNSSDPLLDPSSRCQVGCIRYLKQSAPDAMTKLRCEILDTTKEELYTHIALLRDYAASGKFCAVGEREAVAFVAE